jgi:hypothetical protein
MRKVLIDNIDKRMTAPLAEYLIGKGYEVHGIGFAGSKPISNRLSSVIEVSKDDLINNLSNALSRFSQQDCLIAGNPLIMRAVKEIKPGIRYLLPANESVFLATDKKRLMEFARGIGIKVPESGTGKYPVIVKLNNSENTALKPDQRYRIVNDASGYEKALAYFEGSIDNVIVQEYVDGRGFGVSMLLDSDSDLVDFIVHERIVEYPVAGGPSAVCATIYREELVSAAYRLLRSLKWTGYAMVEFKGDCLIEVNPRHWGSMPLLFAAGSDFFENYIKILDNQHKKIGTETVPYKLNARMYFFPQAYLAVFSLLKKGRLAEAFRALKKIIGAREGIFSLRNPVPFVNYLLSLAGRRIR